MMTGGSRGHAVIVRRLANSLEKRLDANRWTVLTSDFGVDLGPETIRFPDVVVDVAGGLFKDLTATAPALVAEILSPSSEKYDLGGKAHEYMRAASLSTYLVLAQDQAKAWVWDRSETGFPLTPKEIDGHDAIIRIAAFDINIPMLEIYAGVEFE